MILYYTIIGAKMTFKRLWLLFLSIFPSKLPQGVSDFESWASGIIQAYGSPDNDSVRFALAVQIMHLSPTSAYKPKAYFGLVLLKGAATQVAGQVMQDLKAKQAAQIAADQAKAAEPQPVADTTISEVVPSETKV